MNIEDFENFDINKMEIEVNQELVLLKILQIGRHNFFRLKSISEQQLEIIELLKKGEDDISLSKKFEALNKAISESAQQSFLKDYEKVHHPKDE